MEVVATPDVVTVMVTSSTKTIIDKKMQGGMEEMTGPNLAAGVREETETTDATGVGIVTRARGGTGVVTVIATRSAKIEATDIAVIEIVITLIHDDTDITISHVWSLGTLLLGDSCIQCTISGACKHNTMRRCMILQLHSATCVQIGISYVLVCVDNTE